MGRNASDIEDLIFGIVSGDRLARASLTQVCDTLSAGAGRRIRPELCESYGTLADRLESGSLHLGWAPPLIAHRLTQRRMATVAACPRRPGGLAYHSVLFVNARQQARKPEELSGTRAAWVDPSSLSGCVLARRWLARQGLDPER